MPLIQTSDKLNALCDALRRDAFITVDTEFIRERTYWPQLCLIQLAGDQAQGVVDCLAGLDLSPIWALLNAHSILKVFHAARQDLEILYRHSGALPTPLFDTQIAAMVCGFGEQVSYENLVRTYTGQSIDKSSRFTNWAKRPLDPPQIRYALGDVVHLRVVYEKLRLALDQTGRHSWLEEELAALLSPDLYTSPPEKAWQKIKYTPKKPKQKALLMALAQWREEEAQRRDLPKGWILRDEALCELATQAPASVREMEGLRGVSKGYGASVDGKAILRVIETTLASDFSKLPWSPKSEFSPAPWQRALLDLLKMALRVLCENAQVAPKLVATSADLEAFVASNGEEQSLPFLSGWRREVFGRYALDLCEGKLAITFSDRAIVLVPPAPLPQ